MVHAGIPPRWSLPQARARAAEVERLLRGGGLADFASHMYGDNPVCWNDRLQGHERLRLIIDYLTRMRFCDERGMLDLVSHGDRHSAPEGFLPWFSHSRCCAGERVLFGHWAALRGDVGGAENVFALDGGCVWGGRLLAMRLEDGSRFYIDCDARRNGSR